MFRAVKDVKSAHTQVVNRSFAIKGSASQILDVAGDPPQKTAGIKLSGEYPMRGHPYLDVLENGSPFAVKAASLVVAALLVLVVALPVLAVGAAVVA